MLAHMLMKVCVFNERVRTVQRIENTAVSGVLDDRGHVIVSCHDIPCTAKGAGKIVIEGYARHAMVYLDDSARAHGEEGCQMLATTVELPSVDDMKVFLA